MLEGAAPATRAAVAALFFGSNFAPVKRYDTGDGFFFQWVKSSAACRPVRQLADDPKFRAVEELGGALWRRQRDDGPDHQDDRACRWACSGDGHVRLVRSRQGRDLDAALNYAGVGLRRAYLWLSDRAVVNPDGDGAGGDEPRRTARTTRAPTSRCSVPRPRARGSATSAAAAAAAARARSGSCSVCAGVVHGTNFDPLTYGRRAVRARTTTESRAAPRRSGNRSRRVRVTAGLVARRSTSARTARASSAGASRSLKVKARRLMCGRAVCRERPFSFRVPDHVRAASAAALWGVFAFGEIAGRRNYVLALAAAFNIAAAVRCRADWLDQGEQTRRWSTPPGVFPFSLHPGFESNGHHPLGSHPA